MAPKRTGKDDLEQELKETVNPTLLRSTVHTKHNEAKPHAPTHKTTSIDELEEELSATNYPSHGPSRKHSTSTNKPHRPSPMGLQKPSQSEHNKPTPSKPHKPSPSEPHRLLSREPHKATSHTEHVTTVVTEQVVVSPSPRHNTKKDIEDDLVSKLAQDEADLEDQGRFLGDISYPCVTA